MTNFDNFLSEPKFASFAEVAIEVSSRKTTKNEPKMIRLCSF